METLDDFIHSFQKLTKKPERFLCPQDSAYNTSKTILKPLYNFLKLHEAVITKSSALPQLVVDGCDEEQIWQEIELQNEGIYDRLVTNVAHVLAKQGRLRFETEGNSNDDQESEDDLSDIEEELDLTSDEDGEDEEMNNESDEDESSEEEAPDEDDTGPKFTSEIDDEFFKLSEMEQFCDKVEKNDELGTGKMNIPFDFFSVDDDDDENDEDRLIRFNDFFKAPSNKTQKHLRRREFGPGNIGGRFQENEFSEVNEKQDDGFDVNSDSDNNENSKNDGPKSLFDARQDRLKVRIETLEKEALKEKPWYLQGEVSSGSRPHNSLLEEYVEFDIGARPAPVFTEKTTLRLEDIMRQRIKDKSWDDVARKVKPVEDIREYRKQLVLDQEKSKLSLAEIYEQEYIKKRDAVNADRAEVTEDVEPEQHTEIKKLMKNLFTKLDALSNFHYTPKPVQPEIKIVTNMPAINMEEVAPVGTSDVALLAPEEVKHKPKGELLSKSERTVTDKKRERRQKKVKQRMRQKEKEKKEKLISKLPLGLGNKYSKEKARKTLDKLTKERNVDKMVETQSKHLNSSSAFFNKLQDEVKSQVKRKANTEKVKNKKMEKFSAKKMKL